MGKHADLPAMVRFVRKHVAEHLGANGPGLRPAIAQKPCNPAGAIERFPKQLRATTRAFCQGRPSLLRRAAWVTELRRDFDMRRVQPDPFRSDVVHVGEDCADTADPTAGWSTGLSIPDCRIKMFDQKLVDTIVGGEYTDCRRREVLCHSGLGHGCCSLRFLCTESWYVQNI